MKKCSFIGLLSGIFICTGLLFTSCENFLNGSLLKEKIEEDIEYQNAPSYTIRVEAEENTGTITLGAGGYTKKVTDSFDVGFKKNSGYKFIEWRAISSTDGSSLEDCIEFTDKSNLETSCRLVKDSDDITLVPFCESQISFTAAYPEYDEIGVARDSSIKIVFSNELSVENDLSKIKISIDGSNIDAKVYFEDPIFDKESKTLLILAKTSNRITVTKDELKDVIVTIPSNFTYEGAKSGEKLEIGEELKHYYRINSSTCDKTLITYGCDDENAGSFKVNGISDSSVTQQYSIGESITVSFKLADGYIFNGWKCSNEETIFMTLPNTDENPSYDSKGYNSDTRTATISLKIINEGKNVTFAAVVTKLPVENINISSKYGKISPNGIFEYKQTDKVAVTFNADVDYQFIGWKAFSDEAKTVEIPAENISFAQSENENTTFTFNKALTDAPTIYIEPVCVKRPKIVSATPGYEASGVFRDRTIVLIFDNQIELSSIYWTKEELDSLLGDNKNNYVYLEALTTTDGTKYYYAYKNADPNNKSDVTYKNISISRVEDKSSNLLMYYDKPVFDSNNPLFLRIPTSKDNPPPESLNVKVSINKDLGMKSDIATKLITLKEEYSFVYRTNGATDNDPPEFKGYVAGKPFYLGIAKKEVKVVGEKTVVEYKIDKTDENNISIASNNFLETVGSYKANNMFVYDVNGEITSENKDLYVEGSIEDGISGPASLQWTITKLENQYYPFDEYGEFEYHGQIQKVNVSGTTGYISERIALGSLGLTDGAYKISLYAYDVNENVSEPKEYYFIWDNTPPKPVTGISHSRTEPTKAILSYTNSVSKDAKQVTIKRYLASDIENVENKDIGTVTEKASAIANLLTHNQAFTGLTNQELYTYTFCTEDYVGNKTEIERNTATKPAAPALTSKTFKYKKEKVILNSYLSNSFNGYINTYYKKTTETNWSCNSSDKLDMTSSTKRYDLPVTLYTKGKQYDFNVTYTDYSGLESDATNFGKNGNYIDSSGNFVYNNTTIDKTALVNVIDKPTKYSVYTKDDTSLTLRDSDGNNPVIINPKNVLIGPGDQGVAPRIPGAFDANRGSGIVNGAIELQPYAIGRYECINQLVGSVMGTNYTDTKPKTSLNFYQIVQFCNALSILYGFEPCYILTNNSDVDSWSFAWSKSSSDFNNTLKCDFTKNGFRLPSDLEWENASRGGVQNRYADGVYQWFAVFSGTKAKLSADKYFPDTSSGVGGLAGFANYNYHGSPGGITVVGRLRTNWLGLYDMAGNAHEFVWDACDNSGNVSTATIYGYGTNDNGVSGPAGNNCRIIRGGYWGDSETGWSSNFRNSNRHGVGPASGNSNIGWRLARTLGKD